MKHNYIVIDDDYNSVVKTRSVAAGFQNLNFVASAANYDDGLDLILQHQPDIVFLEITPGKSHSNLSLHLINELHRYLSKIPKIIVTAKDSDLALDALRYEVLDYFVKPVSARDLRRALLRFEKNLQAAQEAAAPEAIPNVPIAPPVVELPSVSSDTAETEVAAAVVEAPQCPAAEQPDHAAPAFVTYSTVEKERPLVICVKSYGDYRFIEANDICYLQADNNSTDIHLNNGEMITAFKTLKHFENVLAAPFVRIHNSYIVNIDYVSRIHTGNAVCYIKNTTTKLPFSKSYKENVDSIITSISNGNYLEI